jgi:hypothetical protein
MPPDIIFTGPEDGMLYIAAVGTMQIRRTTRASQRRCFALPSWARDTCIQARHCRQDNSKVLAESLKNHIISWEVIGVFAYSGRGMWTNDCTSTGTVQNVRQRQKQELPVFQCLELYVAAPEGVCYIEPPPPVLASVGPKMKI